MKVPKLFTTDSQSIEKKVEKFMKDSSKKEPFLNKLELLRKAKSTEGEKAFLETLVKHLPYFIEEVRKKMGQNNMDLVYLDSPEDNSQRDHGYRARFEIRSDSHFYFLHSVSGMTYKSDLDDDFLKGYETIHDYLNTYLDKGGQYSSLYGGDFLESSFKRGKEMYEGIKLFLEENKTL